MNKGAKQELLVVHETRIQENTRTKGQDLEIKKKDGLITLNQEIMQNEKINIQGQYMRVDKKLENIQNHTPIIEKAM